MKIPSMAACLLSILLLAGCAAVRERAMVSREVRALEDLGTVQVGLPGQEYRLGGSGVGGLVLEDHIRVTRVEPGSPADGKVQAGDRVRRIQGKSLSSDLLRTVRSQMSRLGRDEAGKLKVTVERPGASGRSENTITLHLVLPPPPGTLQHFGPTGIYGKMDRDHVVVDRVEKGSPADGRLKAGDQIMAVGGRPLAGDVYQLFTECIDAAETREQGGLLNLEVRRPGKDVATGETVLIDLRLRVLGSYSPTAPVDCAKTDAIITRAADAVVRTEESGRLGIGLLGLLATGEKQYIEYVGQVLHRSGFARPDVALSLETPMSGWPWSYRTITMCEYYLLTRDAYVLPSLRAHALTIAQGQDAAGLWNHRMADPAANFGKMHGRLYGYGAINQTSVALWIALILAEKCGVDDPEVRTAIEKTHALYGNWIGKGALPYGNHGPLEHILTNNGTSGSIAVAYSLLGDRAGARYYAMLSAAAHEDILTGHTGPFFNILWSGLGANVAGPEVAAAFDRNVHWLRTLTRAWDGSFLYMEGRGGVFDYSGLSSTGANLLNLCVGRRALFITGKAADTSLWLTGEAATAAVEAGTIDDSKRDRRSLLAELGSPLPSARLEAAEQLAADGARVDAAVMRLLAGGTRDQRIGAVHAIGALKLTSATDALMTVVRDEKEDLWLRQLAVSTLAEWEEAGTCGTELLHTLVADKPYDRFGDLDRTIGSALEKVLGPDPYALDLDKDLFYRAVLKLLAHKHMWGRTAGMALIRNIPMTDLHRVADQVVYVIEDNDRTYTSYHGDEHRQTGLEILNRLNIREVIELTVATIKEPTGRAGPRLRGRMDLLRTFGAEAQGAIPRIQQALGKQAAEIITAIEASAELRQMTALDEAVRKGRLGASDNADR